jgi:hypothetical protein
MSHLKLSQLGAISISIFALQAIGIDRAMANDRNVTNNYTTTPELKLDLGLQDSLSSLTENRIAINQSPTPEANPKQPLGLGITTRVGTLGVGVDVGKSFSPQFSARLGFNFGNVNTNRSESGINYDAKLNLSSVQLMGDYHPFGGGFRVTGGLLSQSNKFVVTGKPDAGGSYTIDNTTYSAAQVGNLTGEYQYGNSIAPYLGIGYGQSTNEGFGFNADLGIMFTGSPKVTLNASNPTFNNNATARAQLDRQASQTESDLKGFNIYPVLSVGVSYGF